MANRTVTAILRLSSKLGNMAAFRQLSGHLDKVDRRAKAFNRSQSLVARGSREMNMMLLRYAAPAALAYGARQAIVSFAEVERRMTRIGITAEASAEDTDKAFQSLQQSAKEFALPLDEVINGLDTLVSSGMSLQDAMDFLPSILATAQASGAATEDIANTAQKAASALKLQASEMQRAFDIMVTGGKEGQFELRDMAAYVPELANSFASLGYQGEEGLKQLVAILQTIREDTGSASAAATQAQNVFGKMYTEETAKKFSNFGIKLRKEMEAARAAGEDAVTAFVRLSKQAIDGDLSKLPLLFTDQEFRLGMQSLMTSADSYKRFIDAVNNEKVDGSVTRDLDRVLEGTKAKIDNLGSSWERLKTSFGEGLVDLGAGGAMDAVSNDLDYGQAVRKALEKRGMGYWERENFILRNRFFNDEALDSAAWQGGYRTQEEKDAIEAYGQLAKTRRESEASMPRLPADASGMPVAGPIPAGRDGSRPIVVPQNTVSAPVPTSRPSQAELDRIAFNREFDAYQGGAVRTSAPRMPLPAGVSPREAERESMQALRSDPNGVAEAIDMALASGGEKAGTRIERAGEDAGSAFARMLDGVAAMFGRQAAESFRNHVGTVPVRAQVTGGGAGAVNVTGNRGRTMPNAGQTPRPE